jgi:hypothetical protein
MARIIPDNILAPKNLIKKHYRKFFAILQKTTTLLRLNEINKDVREFVLTV